MRVIEWQQNKKSYTKVRKSLFATRAQYFLPHSIYNFNGTMHDDAAAGRLAEKKSTPSRPTIKTSYTI